jgi:FkbM family methyltransferase
LKALRIIAKIAAKICERNKTIRGFIKNHNFKGKYLIVDYINPASTKNYQSEFIDECDGIKYKFNLKDNLQKEIYFNSYENANLKLVLSLIKPGSVCLDIGANIGVYTLHIAKKLNHLGNVYSFEPDPSNFRRLKENCQLNSFCESVKLFEIALSNSSDTVTLYQCDDSNSGWHSLTKFSDIAVSQTEVKAETLDNIINKLQITEIQLIKIDVEANEFELLEGAEQTLKSRLSKYIFIEFNGPRLAEKNRSLEEFLNLFQQYGYYPTLINLDVISKSKHGTTDPKNICTDFLFKTEFIN